MLTNLFCCVVIFLVQVIPISEDVRRVLLLMIIGVGISVTKRKLMII